MKVLVLGGCGTQGRTAIYDLARCAAVEAVICADARLRELKQIKAFTDLSKVRAVQLDAKDSNSFTDLLQQVDVAIDLLPRQYTRGVCQAAIQTGTDVVNTNYAYEISDLDEQAKAARVAIMGACGLDPGIDLVLYAKARQQFDELHLINSYCGGFPEESACDNPLNYKISWTWEGVLSSTMRDSRIIKNGALVDIPGQKQHDAEFLHQIDFPGIGRLEAIPNGDAVFFTDLLGVTATIVETGRYSLRWPGWSAFWRPLKRLGFLNEAPVEGLPCEVSPRQFLDKLMGPQLCYRDDERDLVAMLNIFEGLIQGQRKRLTYRLLIQRDLETGLMAMSKGVAFPASIVAQMIARGEIAAKGILSPIHHIPCDPFLEQLAARGIVIDEGQEALG